MTDTNRLKGAIMSAGYTQEKLAEKLNITATALNNKINNRSPFKASEVFQIAEILGIDNAKDIFYTPKAH